MTAPITKVTYTATGSSQTEAVPFPYLHKADVRVYFAGILQVVGVGYTWPTDSTINFTATAAADVLFQRFTNDATLEATIQAGTIRTADINNQALQDLYLHQESVTQIDDVTGVPAGGTTGQVLVKVDDTDYNTEWSTLDPYRTKINGNRTYYVATTGSDANNGLDVSTPFLTIQKAIDVIQDTLDLGGNNVTISVANGTYAAPVVVDGPWVGAGIVTLSCAAAIGSVVIQAANCISCERGGVLTVSGGFDLQATSLGLISRHAGSRLLIGSGVQFNAIVGAGLAQCYVTRLAYMEITGTVYVTGGCSSFIQSSHHGNFRMGSGGIVQFQANATYDYTLYAEDLADITFTGTAAFNLNGKTVTGRKGLVTSNSNIQWAAKSFTDIPGTLEALELSGGCFSFGGPTAQSEQDFYAVSQTYDLSTASGNVVVTGVGFKPSLIRISQGLSTFGSGTSGSMGACYCLNASGAFTQQCMINSHIIAAGTWSASAVAILFYYANAGGTNYVVGTITATSSDGFTIAMVKTGTPTGTIRLNIECYR